MNHHKSVSQSVNIIWIVGLLFPKLSQDHVLQHAIKQFDVQNLFMFLFLFFLTYSFDSFLFFVFFFFNDHREGLGLGKNLRENRKYFEDQTYGRQLLISKIQFLITDSNFTIFLLGGIENQVIL